MREITIHVTNPANDKLKITATDEPGAGGAHHVYRISGFSEEGMPEGSGYITLSFQNGPINEVGLNGVTQEALLAVVADRLQSFQNGPYACEENRQAFEHVIGAMNALKARTQARMARGVEGTNKV